MSAEAPLISQAPKENFSRGLFQIEIPELGKPIEGKVRDSWIFKKGDSEFRVLITTDRQSAFDSIVCTTPGKGQVLNLMSAFWFEYTRDIIPNHMVAIPHPNVLIARQAEATLPVEVVVRRYMAKSSTSTSVYDNYINRGRRMIYGVDFPEGLKQNQEFPMGTIITPTTKAEAGHDEELTDQEAAGIVDGKLGKGVWKQARNAADALFERARLYSLGRGLILVDTKYEFGIDKNRELMLIDEVHTPDSSRYWLAKTYKQRIEEGKNPDTFDKEILRRWLTKKRFKGQCPIPKVDPKIINQMSEAYEVPYRMITGEQLPSRVGNVSEQVRHAVMRYVNLKF
ncbi:MAG: phosphoribosylaminoimidazolesuccinocarboxamide synthase [Candidatus Levybacteria bacterium]|nr:phosphoribosylaminoimidazolesuccinocarboxamide synthase [Candidatus Levybacteria bacterium]MDZ4227832.1 phosphoribosylaminoimidazolesuccinocarboxamide synthase [Candidatus Levybacteria bacterium]